MVLPDVLSAGELSSPRIDDSWRRWIAENLLLGGDSSSIAATMVDAGFSMEESNSEIERAAASPYLAGAQRLRNRLAKRDWLIDTRRRMERLLPAGIERRERLAAGEFLRDYYSAGRPVIITGMMDAWPAMRRWSIELLARDYAEQLVEVQVGRDANEHYEQDKERHQRRMRFGDFIDRIRGPVSSNDLYLTAYNGAFNREALAALLDDVPGLPEYLDASSPDRGFLWIGPRGTITPMHHDLTNNLLAQVVGRKRFVIASSSEISNLYNQEHCFSAVDARRIDFAAHPAMREVRLYDFTLEPGELLFIPVGWWHFVEGLEFSMTLTFINFRWDNHFAGNYPREHAF